ncbi:transposase [Microbispora amethystogenes]|uniref:IS110 family transposase n=1 Tax=Microbispora amethystogenes TaxID=1427754 RepID=UPI0033CA277B
MVLQLRPVAGDSQQAEAIKVVTRTHKTLIRDRTRHTQRLRHAVRDYFPAALTALSTQCCGAGIWVNRPWWQPPTPPPPAPWSPSWPP